MGSSHRHVVDGHPAVGWEVLQHGDQELQAAVPVTQQEHHPNEVEDANHSTGQVIGHVKDLWGPREGRCGQGPSLPGPLHSQPCKFSLNVSLAPAP